MRMCDFSRSQPVTPSYMKYPSDHPQKRYSHSGQSLWREDAAVLNTTVCSVGDMNSKRFSIEAYDGPSTRRNVYEEVLNKIEDERYEMDMAIERNFSTMRLIQPVADEVTALKEQEERDGQPIGRIHYKLMAKALGPNHIGAIARLYGDKGDEVVQLLSRNPIAVLPVVYKRLREKNEEWRAVRTEWNKQWKKAQADNFEGSFDVECHLKKRHLDQYLSSDHFISVCKQVAEFCNVHMSVCCTRKTYSFADH
jgi:paired amphipathic helix protein Sin3a